MNNYKSNTNIRSLLLPQLREDKVNVQVGDVGNWTVRSKDEYRKIATSLDLGESQQFGQDSQTVTSVPNVWARALLMETALYNPDYPLHKQMVAQWQGMLAAIAFAEMRQFNLRAELVNLDELRSTNDRFVRSLLSLLPQPTFALYSLQGSSPNSYNPWHELYVFSWNGNPVGLSSPSTLVCPIEHGNWDKLDWYQGGKLTSPTSYLIEEDKQLLYCWLDNLVNGLAGYGGERNALNTFTRLLEGFRNSLNVEAAQTWELSRNNFFFNNESLNRGALKLINRPLKAVSKPSSVKLIPSADRLKELHVFQEEQELSESELLIIDLELDKIWNKLPQEIYVYGNITLATIEQLNKFTKSPGPKVDVYTYEEDGQKKTVTKRTEWINVEDLFLSELYFIKFSRAFPGALMPLGYDEDLTYKDVPITPILPINPKLLDYLTPEDIQSSLEVRTVGDGVEFSLDLNLSGFSNIESPKVRRYSRRYVLREENALENVPVFEIWPNFRTNEWHQYHTFYYDQGFGDRTFQVSFPGEISQTAQRFKEGSETYQIDRLTDFPSYVECHQNSKTPQPLGIILLASPPITDEIDSGVWKVGVDFGTSFTNVYVNHNDEVFPLELDGLHLQVTLSIPEMRNRVLIEFFSTDRKELLKFPMCSVLTTRMSYRIKQDLKDEELTPYLGGCIYIPEDSNSLKPQREYIKTGLKWSTESSDKRFSRSFLDHLALQITALAAKQGISQIEWFISYPSAFSQVDLNTYYDNWQYVTKDIESFTSIKQICVELGDLEHWRPESVASAQYFADWEKRDLVYSSCIDIGGGTSDISIWENNSLVHQCSIQLAGYHLFSQFLEMNPKLVSEMLRKNPKNKAKDDKEHIDIREWSKLKKSKFAAKLDVLLRREGDQWLRRRRDEISKKPEFQGLLQLMAIGTSGLYYYLGTLLKVLHKEGYYKEGKITPVYVGGNGARLLSWLAEGGRFDHNRAINGLFSQMLTRASGFLDTKRKVSTYVSSNPKDEVACGLVLNDNRLRGWENENKLNSRLILGEACSINGQSLSPYDYLPEQVAKFDEFEIPDSFENFRQFLDDFNQSLRDLNNPAGIKPIVVNDRDFEDFHRELRALLLKKMGKTEEIRLEPPFILVLKAVLSVYGKRWAAG